MADTATANTRLGRFLETPVAGEVVRAFVPPPLPPEPPIDVLSLLERLSVAERALGRLDGITMLLPRQELFLYMYVRKEAVLSSQIEGTQSTLSDLLRFETDAQAGEPIDDIREVSNYVDAMMFGLERLGELPLSLRLIREMHARLLQSGRGGTKSPANSGARRTGSAAAGRATPCSSRRLSTSSTRPWARSKPSCMRTNRSCQPSSRPGSLHVQFETIHPFLDGNGRIGRLLVTLYLCVHGVLRKPLLYLSLYFKTRRADYYRLLQEVRERGAWEAWLEFFLDGVAETANQAFDAATRIVHLFKEDRERITAESERVGSALRIHDLMQQNPYVSSNQLVERVSLSSPTVNTALADLERLGIVEEVTGRRRGRVFGYRRYLAILSEGTDPLPTS